MVKQPKSSKEIRDVTAFTLEEEKAFLNEEYAKAAQGEHITISKLYEAYQKKVGHKTTREGLYALLKRHGWRKVTPRPEHPLKADATVIEVSKNKIYCKEGKKAL